MKIMHTCTQRPWYVWLSLKKNSIFYQKSGLILLHIVLTWRSQCSPPFLAHGNLNPPLVLTDNP